MTVQRKFVNMRVRDLWTGGLGTVTEDAGRGWYRVAWDVPTPNQETALARIPSEFFEWAP